MARILVVDDEASLRRVIRRCLEREGYEVDEAPDAEALARALIVRRPDLILLDVHMPGTNGTEALRDVAALAPHAAVIMITGDQDLSTIRLALDRGASEYLVKPFTLADLTASIRAVLEQRRPGPPGAGT